VSVKLAPEICINNAASNSRLTAAGRRATASDNHSQNCLQTLFFFFPTFDETTTELHLHAEKLTETVLHLNLGHFVGFFSYLNIRPQTLKLIQEKVGNTLELVDIGKNFLNGTPTAQQLRDSIDKWDFTKLKSFCSTKEMVCKLKRTPTEWEKIFASYTSEKD
jgi:hypothetical protein